MSSFAAPQFLLRVEKSLVLRPLAPKVLPPQCHESFGEAAKQPRRPLPCEQLLDGPAVTHLSHLILFYFVNAVLLLACNLNYFEERFFIFFFRFPSDLNGSFERQASPFTSTLSGLNQSCGQLWWRGGGGERKASQRGKIDRSDNRRD